MLRAGGSPTPLATHPRPLAGGFGSADDPKPPSRGRRGVGGGGVARGVEDPPALVVPCITLHHSRLSVWCDARLYHVIQPKRVDMRGHAEVQRYGGECVFAAGRDYPVRAAAAGCRHRI